MHPKLQLTPSGRFVLALGTLGLIALAGTPARAQTQTTAGATGTTTTTVTTPEATTQASGSATVEATAATDAAGQVAARAALAKQIEARSAATASAEVTKQTDKMTDAAHKVDTDAEASSDASAKIASRLATQFHMDAGAVMTEKQQLDVSWGNLMIAHTLSGSAKDVANASVENLVALHKDGMGWGKIAAGLGFKLGAAVSAVQAEGRVAQGQAQASGKLSHIAAAASVHGDPDAAGGEASAAAHGAAANASADAAANAANAATHVDAGLHVGSGK